MDNSSIETEMLEQPVQADGEKPVGMGKVSAGYSKFKHMVGKIVMFLYHMRRVFMAAPVVFYALKLAGYNMQHLPEKVGLFLQTNGEYAQMIDRGLAVTGPLVITAACLFLMFFSRKAMHSWAISIFSLALPIVLLVSNMYPA